MFNIRHNDDHVLVYTDTADRQWRVDEDGEVPEVMMAAAAAQAVNRGIDNVSVTNGAWSPPETDSPKLVDYRACKRQQLWKSVNVTRLYLSEGSSDPFFQG